MGPPQLPTFTNNLTVVKDICSLLGIPLALEKIEGPSQNFTFLGITLDTNSMQARLPEGKLRRIQNQVATWLPRKKATKREILSLVGLLQHATKVFIPGRTFVSERTVQQPVSKNCLILRDSQRTFIQTYGGGTSSSHIGMG